VFISGGAVMIESRFVGWSRRFEKHAVSIFRRMGLLTGWCWRHLEVRASAFPRNVDV